MIPDNSKRNAEIVDLRRRDWMPAEIARHLGVSKNIVIGVLFRAGMTDARSPLSNGRGLDYEAAFKRQVIDSARQAQTLADAARAWGVPWNTLKGWMRAEQRAAR